MGRGQRTPPHCGRVELPPPNPLISPSEWFKPLHHASGPCVTPPGLIPWSWHLIEQHPSLVSTLYVLSVTRRRCAVNDCDCVRMHWIETWKQIYRQCIYYHWSITCHRNPQRNRKLWIFHNSTKHFNEWSRCVISGVVSWWQLCSCGAFLGK